MIFAHIGTGDVLPEADNYINGKTSYSQNQVHDLHDRVFLVAYVVEDSK